MCYGMTLGTKLLAMLPLFLTSQPNAKQTPLNTWLLAWNDGNAA